LNYGQEKLNPLTYILLNIFKGGCRLKNNNEVDLKGLADYVVTKKGIFTDTKEKKAVNS